MAEKKAPPTAAPKGPSMALVIHNGSKVWANRTSKGFYRCTVCSLESHERVPSK